MQLTWLCLLGLVYCSEIARSSKASTSFLPSTAQRNDIFTSSFLVRFHRSIDNDLAHDVAQRNGFENLGAVSICFKGFSYSFLLPYCNEKKNIEVT